MEKQMELFEDGGLKDEGGMVDEQSGNDVPVGSSRKEVRDDIPAMLSEGEFVFPADVVRYHGLDKLMDLRQEAKMGLKQMEAMVKWVIVKKPLCQMTCLLVPVILSLSVVR